MAFAADKLGFTTMHATTLALVEGREVKNIGEIASRLNKEPSQVAHNIERLKGEFTAQARIAFGMDEATFADFTEWAWSTERDGQRRARSHRLASVQRRPPWSEVVGREVHGCWLAHLRRRLPGGRVRERHHRAS
jgi:hypothetical protein